LHSTTTAAGCVHSSDGGAEPAREVLQLAARLRELERRYEEVYIVGHSLGGLVAGAALQEYIQGRSKHDALTPIAALVLVASPRAGSPYGRIMHWLRFKEGPWLTSSGEPAQRIDRFFSSCVQGHALATAGPNQYLVPQYALIDDRRGAARAPARRPRRSAPSKTGAHAHPSVSCADLSRRGAPVLVAGADKPFQRGDNSSRRLTGVRTNVSDLRIL
jgi:pimeloyl-ACP methyl ester carboxylesterase